MLSLAHQLDILDIRRDFGWQRLRLGLGEAVEAAPEDQSGARGWRRGFS